MRDDEMKRAAWSTNLMLATTCMSLISVGLMNYTLRVRAPKPHLAEWQEINTRTFAELDRKNLFYNVRTGAKEETSISDESIRPVLRLVNAACEQHDPDLARAALAAAVALPRNKHREPATWPSPLLGRVLSLI